VSDSPSVYVHLLPSLIPAGSLRGGVAVVIDVLRATTVMIQALHSGCVAIAPCLEIDEALQLAASLPIGRAILAGERLGLPIEGFDLGNSPGSFTPEACAGKTVVITTTNGTRAIHASLDADRILVAAFANLTATVRALRTEPRPVHLVCSGTNGLVSIEDSLLAGSIATLLRGTHHLNGNDEAILTSDASNGAGDRPLIEAIRRGWGGRRVTEIGLEDDLVFAADIDRFDLVAEVIREPLRVVLSR
jgi:2-phosphosulfolactate phosphatase